MMTEYVPLASSPDDFGEKVHTAPTSGLSPWDKWIAGSALVLTVLSTLLSFSIYLTGSNPLSDTPKTLKRPNPYPNLHSVFSSNSSIEPFSPIFSLSQVLLQIQNSDSRRMMHEDTSRQRLTAEGTVFPDDRHFIASREFSTIIQFKTLDFGMERCVLKVVLPNKTDELDPAIHLDEPSIVDLWSLDFDEEMNVHNSQTWLKAPERRFRFAQFVFPSRTMWSSVEFHCPALTWNTFEFACAPGVAGCHVEFWQDRAAPNGIYMQQFDSINV